jgi:hypothetical protein
MEGGTYILVVSCWSILSKKQLMVIATGEKKGNCRDDKSMLPEDNERKPENADNRRGIDG